MENTNEVGPLNNHCANTGDVDVDFVLAPAGDAELIEVTPFNAGSVELRISAADYCDGGTDGGLPMALSIAYQGARGGGLVKYVHIDDADKAQILRIKTDWLDCLDKNADLVQNSMKLLAMVTDLNEQYVAHLERPLGQRVRDFGYEILFIVAGWFRRKS